MAGIGKAGASLAGVQTGPRKPNETIEVGGRGNNRRIRNPAYDAWLEAQNQQSDQGSQAQSGGGRNLGHYQSSEVPNVTINYNLGGYPSIPQISTPTRPMVGPQSLRGKRRAGGADVGGNTGDLGRRGKLK